MASDAAITAIVARPSATEPRLLLGDLKPGVYYVRLRAGGQAPDTDVYRFELPGNWGSTIFDVSFALTKAR